VKPDEASVKLIGQVAILNDQGKYIEVIELLSNELLENLQNSELYSERARAFYKLYQTEKGFEEYDSPNNFFRESDALDNTIEDITKAIQLLSNNSELYFRLGNCWLDKMEHYKAIEEYTKAIQLNLNDANLYLNRGAVWHYKREYSKAIEDATKAIQLEPMNPAPYINRGASFNFLQQYNNAIEDFTKAIQLNPLEAGGYHNRAIMWEKQQEYDKAIIDYAQAIKLKKNDPLFHTSIGFAYFAINRYEKALEHFTIGIQLDENFDYAYFGLYCYYDVMNEAILAVPYLKRATHLGYDTDQLLSAFNKYPAPFIVKKLLTNIAKSQGLMPFLETVIKNQKHCREWQLYLDFIHINNYLLINPRKYWQSRALIEYYMGNCFESHTIYDKTLNYYDNELKLDLQDKFYFIKSAQDFIEPFTSIIESAIELLEIDTELSIEDYYYAGQIFMLNNNIDTATIYFLKAKDFLPALYRLLGIYIKGEVVKFNEVFDKILFMEASSANRHSFINGIDTLIVNEIELSNLYKVCNYYAYYSEIIDEIQFMRQEVETRIEKGKITWHEIQFFTTYKHCEFWESIIIEETKRAEILTSINLHENKELENLLQELFTKNCQTTSIEVLGQEISTSGASKVFKAIKDEAADTDLQTNIEQVMAIKIKNLDIEIYWYFLFCKMFFLKNELSLKNAVILQLYAQYRAMKSGDSKKIDEANQGILLNIIEGISFNQPLIIKIVINTILSLHKAFSSTAINRNDYKNYEKFKLNLYNYLNEWKTTIYKDKFERNFKEMNLQ